MLEIWRSPRFAMKARLRETAAFLARLLNPTIKSDYAFPGDRTLYWRRVGQVIRGWLRAARSEEHTSELQSLMRISYAVFCLKKKKQYHKKKTQRQPDTTSIIHNASLVNN